MKRIGIYLISLVLLSNRLLAQQYSHLDVKLGISQSFLSPNISKGNYFRNSYPLLSPLPVFGIEYCKPIQKKNTIFFAGVSLDMQTIGTGYNFENISSITGGGGVSYTSNTGALKFYAGVERKFSNKERRLNQNYFSWFAGAGISYNLGKFGDPVSFSGALEGLTKSGQQFYGGFYREDRFSPGSYFYQSQIDFGRAHRFSPTLMAGARWHVLNKRGGNVLTIELQGTYGITRYQNMSFAYTLDGVEKKDFVGDRGISAQLNFLIPLKNFGKKNK